MSLRGRPDVARLRSRGAGQCGRSEPAGGFATGSGGNLTVFVILGIAFAAIGVHLFLWSRRQRGLVRRFAQSKGLAYRAEAPERLGELVNRSISLEEAGLVRDFGRLGDVVSLGKGTLFRAVELLDLNPWGSAGSSHHSRIAVFFECDAPVSGIFLVLPDGSVRQRYPVSGVGAAAVRAMIDGAGLPPVPCPLSLTVMRGFAVACLEPLVVGSFTREHLEYLAGLCDRLATGPGATF